MALGPSLRKLNLFARKFYLALVILGVAFLEVLFWGLAHMGIVRFEPKIDLAGLTAVPLFLIGILQLFRQTAIRRANFITSYIAKFHTEHDLRETFNELIASYSDAKYEAVKDAVKKQGVTDTTGAFTAIASLQDGRREGHRFYCPDYFQGSPEERKLDALLGYLDVIGYQYVHGLVNMADIAGMLGYQLSVVMARTVITEYLDGTDLKWWRSTPQSRDSALVPFVYLRALLAGFKEYNVRYKKKLEGQFKQTQSDWQRLKEKQLN